MTRSILWLCSFLLVVPVCAHAEEAGADAPDVVSGATAPASKLSPRFDALVISDYFHASSAQSGAGGGSPDVLRAHETGLRLRLRGRDLKETLFFEVDYRGREALSRDIENTSRHVLYKAEVGYQLVERRITVAGGRFAAPAVGLLVVDGARSDLVFGPLRSLTVSMFGGQRAISGVFREIDAGEFVPAAGGAVAWDGSRAHAAAGGAYARDEILFVAASELPKSPVVNASSAWARTHGRPHDSLTLGSSVFFAERAGYVFGPTWKAVEINVETLDLWRAMAFAQWRPRHDLRFGADAYQQRVSVFRQGFVDNSSGALVPNVEDPRFTDLRAEAGYRPMDRGWVLLDARYRDRPDRTEVRYRSRIDLDRIGVPGLFTRGSYALDDVSFDDPAKGDVLRTRWSASAGYRYRALDVETGASFIERGLTPVSGRLTQGRTPDDLYPFSLTAQRVAFLRAFYGWGSWFGAADAELNLEDPRGQEMRFFLQIGWQTQASW